MSHQIGDVLGKQYGLHIVVTGYRPYKSGKMIEYITELRDVQKKCSAPTCKNDRLTSSLWCSLCYELAILMQSENAGYDKDKLRNN